MSRCYAYRVTLTMLEQKGNPMFDGLRASLREFITTLKARRS